MRLPARQTAGYVMLLAALFVLAVSAGMTPLGAQFDNAVYDWMYRLAAPSRWTPQSILVAIDESSFQELGGLHGLRGMLAEGLERLAAVSPKAVAVDVTLADAGDPGDDARLEAAFRKTPNLVLPADLLPGGAGWEEPPERFRRLAAAIGHVHADPDRYDGINRQIPLEKAADRKRYWALALEAFRLSLGRPPVLESPSDIQVGEVTIPSARAEGRPMRIRYLPPDAEGNSPIPRISLKQLRDDPSLAERCRGKVVFVGVTAQSAIRDRLMTPYSDGRAMPGVEIHASAFETLAQGRFFTTARDLFVVGFSLALAVVAGLVFHFFSGWAAYGCGIALLGVAHATPYALLQAGTVFSYSTPMSAAWLTVVGAAAYQHFAVRRRLRSAETEKSRYQQAMHFVTHEMRTPLTAIQGSSELMSRYALSDQKRKQIADLIHSESRRLARMIETFLNVERLSAGQMELRKEPFPVQEIVTACVSRARPLAERKRIRLVLETLPEDNLLGDRELMEYAFYNLVTNAIKYSPPDTEVAVGGRREGDHVRLHVRDQGIGMDEKELRNIFRKFYRTKRAEASGESGTGIGLSIVEQIVTHHGGRIEVTSAPGRGSCFTLVLPAAAPAHAAEVQ